MPKTLCETLTVADAILFHVVGSRADNELSRRGFRLLSLNMRCSPIRDRPLRRGCHAARTMVRLTRQCKRRSKYRMRPCQPASGSAGQHDPRLGSLDQRRWPEQVDHTDLERRHSQDQEMGTKNPEGIYITNMLQNPE